MPITYKLIPALRFQALKIAICPGWLIKKFPVKYKKIDIEETQTVTCNVNFDMTVIYPEIEIPDSQAYAEINILDCGVKQLWKQWSEGPGMEMTYQEEENLKVETTLNGFGIQTRDKTTGQYRSVNEVMMDIGGYLKEKRKIGNGKSYQTVKETIMLTLLGRRYRYECS